MPTEIDQISNIIGAQGAQLTSLTGAIGELRAEILQNRVRAEEHRAREMSEWEAVRAELRNTKHDYRNLQMLNQALSTRLDKLDGKIASIETMMLEIEVKMKVWRGQAAVVFGVFGAVGILIGSFAAPVVRLLERVL